MANGRLYLINMQLSTASDAELCCRLLLLPLVEMQIEQTRAATEKTILYLPVFFSCGLCVLLSSPLSSISGSE